jgi:hypothetical protein
MIYGIKLLPVKLIKCAFKDSAGLDDVNPTMTATVLPAILRLTNASQLK